MDGEKKKYELVNMLVLFFTNDAYVIVKDTLEYKRFTKSDLLIGGRDGDLVKLSGKFVDSVPYGLPIDINENDKDIVRILAQSFFPTLEIDSIGIDGGCLMFKIFVNDLVIDIKQGLLFTKHF